MIAAVALVRHNAASLVGATVLLHVVFASESLIAIRTEHVSIPSVLPCVACCMAGGGKEFQAAVLLRERARMPFLLGNSWATIVVGFCIGNT